MPKSFCLFAFLGFVLFTGALTAQYGIRFERMHEVDELSQSIVYRLAQDDHGNLWLATDEGVLRYNSHQSFHYHTHRGLPSGFGGRIRSVTTDADGQVWLGAEHGIARYDAGRDSFVLGDRFDQPHLVKEIIPARDSGIWVGAYNGVWHVAKDTRAVERIGTLTGIESLLVLPDGSLLVGTTGGLHHLPVSGPPERDLPLEDGTAYTVFSLLPQGKRILVGTADRGLLLLDPQTFNLRPASLDLADYPIRALHGSPAGGVYLGTDGDGLIELDTAFHTVRHFTNDVNQPHSLGSNGVYDLLRDREGLLWVATYGGGLHVLNAVKNRFIHYTHVMNSDRGLRHPFTRSLLEDDRGRLWFGTKQGISILDSVAGRWHHLPERVDPADVPIVMCLTQDAESVYAGTYDHGLYRIRKSDLHAEAVAGVSRRQSRIYAAAIDGNNQLWIGGVNRNMARLNPDGSKQEFPVTQVKAIIAARGGGVWAAGRNGLAHLAGEKVRTVAAVAPDRSERPYSTINCLYESPEGIVLLGTNGAGLLLYFPESDSTMIIGRNRGLPSNIVQGILPGKTAQIFWLSTTRGIAEVDIERGEVKQIFDAEDGPLTTEYNYNSFLRRDNGQLLFGGPTGVTAFDPSDELLGPARPAVVFEAFELFNDRISPGQGPLPRHLNQLDRLTLDHDQNSFGLHFAGVLHSVPGKVLYRYRLRGLTSEWSAATEVGEANYTNLDPGRYAFQVQAAAGTGPWSEVRSLGIRIAQPWYRSTGAYLIYLIVLLGMTAALIHFVGLTIKKRNADRRINFFNTIAHELKTPLSVLLASLDRITEEEDGSSVQARNKVRQTVRRLNGLFDQLLNFHRSTAADPDSVEVETLDPLATVRELGEGFGPLLRESELELDVEAEAVPEIFYYNREEFERVYLNLLSNAIKYSRPGGRITVRLTGRSEDSLHLAVSDEGIGIPRDQQKHILNEFYRARNAVNSQVSGTGLGLMMVKRIVQRNGGQITFESREDVGTTFSLYLPSRARDFAAQQRRAAGAGEIVIPEAANVSTEAAARQQPTVLIVEDNDELRRTLRERLESRYVIHEARNGREGLQMAEETYPDLIVTDLIMPEMDGMELAASVQRDIKLSHIPIFMLTVLHNSEQKVDSIRLGIAEYMEKPINFDLLLARIEATLKTREKLRRRYTQELELQRAGEQQESREEQFLADLETHVLEQITDEQFGVTELSEFAGMSRTSLYMKLKNIADLSPQDFINHVRLKLARKLLAESGESVKEVAYRCGFSSPKYFSTAFKKKFGVPPSKFQRELVKK